jgi:phage terminase large subunit GpA-like protein
MAQPVWLRGPIDGVHALLQPVAHALVQANEDVRESLAGLSDDTIWSRPGGAASIGFHATHALGSLDRLLTYARGEALNDVQLAVLAGEKTLDRAGSAEQLMASWSTEVDRALGQLRQTREEDLTQPREVGRGKLPSNVIGLLFHAAEHTAQHAAQLVTTAKILRGGW